MGMYDDILGTSQGGSSGAYDDILGVQPATKKQNKGIASDLVTDVKRGVQQLPGAVTGLIDIPVAAVTGSPLVSGLADKAGEITGFQPSKWAKSAEAEYSPSRQAGRAEVDNAWEQGTVSDIAGSYLKNPMNIVGSVAESIPSMLVGGLAGRAALGIGAKTVSAGAGGVGAALPGVIARTVGTSMAPAVGAGIGEGGIMAGQAMQNSLEAGVDPRTAAGYAGATGLVGGALGALGGKVAQKFGVVDPETLIAGGIGRQASNATGMAAAKEVGKRVAGGAISEGLFEELPQSVFEQGFQNIAQGKPITEGMARAGVEGALAGSFMGGAFNAIPGGRYADNKANPNAAPQDTPAVPPDVSLTADPVPVQQRIDAMLGLDAARMSDEGRKQYEVDLVAAFNEPIGIRLDANQNEVPFTMGEYLDTQVKVVDDVRRGIPQRRTDIRADAVTRLEQIANEESQQQAEITQDLTRSAAQGGALSKAALSGIATGATQMPVSPLRQAAIADLQRRMATQAQPTTTSPLQQTATQLNMPAQNISTNPVTNVQEKRNAFGLPIGYTVAVGKGSKESVSANALAQGDWIEDNGNYLSVEKVTQKGDGSVDVLVGSAGGKQTINLGGNRKVSRRKIVKSGQADSIKQLQAQLEQADPFSEQSSALTEKLQSAVTQDAQSALSAGQMPVYKVTDQVSVAIHPSAQNPGMVQVTRYTKDGVIGDSQYNNVDEAVTQEGLTHKPRIASNEAAAVIEQSIRAEAGYQQRKAASVMPSTPQAEKRAAGPIKNWTNVELQSRLDRADSGESPLKPESRQAIEAELAKRPVRKEQAKHGLSIGKAPNAAEPVSIRKGVIYVGDYPAIDYETEADITVPENATPKQIVDALKQGGAIGSNKVFGLPKEDQQVEPIANPIEEAKAKLETIKAERKSRLTPMADDRIAKYADDLRAMAPDAGWAEEGGKLLRDANDNAVGRTAWVAHAGWFRAGMINSPSETLVAVEKAIAGQPMKANEKRSISGMMDYLDAQNEGIEQDTEVSDILEQANYDGEPRAFQDVVNLLGDFDIDAPGAMQDANAAMASLGFTEEEINENAQRESGNTGRGRGENQETPNMEAQEGVSNRDEARQGQQQEGFDLAAQTPEQLRAKAEQERAAAAKAHREEVAAVRAESSAKNKAEKDRRAAQVIAEDKARRDAELAKLQNPDDFVFGNNAPAAPAPVVNRVTTEQARGQGDVFAQQKPQGQRRAAVGGELGANGEWYEGGKFIANTDRAKSKSKWNKPTGKALVDRGVFAEPPSIESADNIGLVPVFPMLAGIETFNEAQNMFSLNPILSGPYATKEGLDERRALIDAWNNGGRWRAVSRDENGQRTPLQSFFDMDGKPIDGVKQSNPVQSNAKSDASLDRTKDRNEVRFETPYIGIGGNYSLVGYVWPNKKEEYIDRRGEDSVRTVSDWEAAVENLETGRQIVHQFAVKKSDGTEQDVSAETAAKLLGVSESTVRNNAKKQLEKAIAKEKSRILEIKEADDLDAIDAQDSPAMAVSKRSMTYSNNSPMIERMAKSGEAWAAIDNRIERESAGREKYRFLTKDGKFVWSHSFVREGDEEYKRGWRNAEFTASEIWPAQPSEPVAQPEQKAVSNQINKGETGYSEAHGEMGDYILDLVGNNNYKKVGAKEAYRMYKNNQMTSPVINEEEFTDAFEQIAPDRKAQPKAEPAKAQDGDWLNTLFGQAPSAEQAEKENADSVKSAQDKADRVDAAIAMLSGEIKANNAAAAELAARKYKANRKQIELQGDGPGRNGSMSISAINESRKRRAIEASLNASSAIKKAIEFISENPDSAFKQVLDMESAVTKQFNEGFFGKSAKLDDQLDMAVGSLIDSSRYSGEGSAGRKLRMAAHAYFAKAQEPAAKEPWQIPKKFFVIDRGNSRGQETVIGLYDTKKDAADAAKGNYGALIFDGIKGVALRMDGTKITGRDDLGQSLGIAFRTGESSSAHLLGIDAPGFTPEWMLTVADKKERFKRSDDDFSNYDNEQHRMAVEAAVTLGKPVPANVLADYPDLKPATKELSAEQKIRAAFNALPSITMDKLYPITVEHNGVTREFIAYQQSIGRGNNKSVIHLATVKRGKMIASDDSGAVVNTYTLDGKDNLKETGMPRYATPEDLKQWTDAGFKNPMGEKPVTVDAAKQPEFEAWHTSIPSEGLPLTKEQEAGKLNSYETIPGVVAADAWDAITQTQKTGQIGLYAYVKPAAGWLNGIVRLFPDDQTPPAPWKLLDPQVIRQGAMTREQGVAKLRELLRSAPILGEKQSVKQPETKAAVSIDSAGLNRLLKSSGVQADSIGRKFYADDGYITVIKFDAKLEPKEAKRQITKAYEIAQKNGSSVDSHAIALRRNGGIIWTVAGKRGFKDKSTLPMGVVQAEYVDSATTETKAAEQEAKPDDGIRYSKASNKSWYYSQLSKAIEQAPDRVFTTGAQVKLWLAGNKSKVGIKDDEIQWTGINDYLDLQGKAKVTKADVLAYLDGNGVQVQEVVKGNISNIDRLNAMPRDVFAAAYEDEFGETPEEASGPEWEQDDLAVRLDESMEVADTSIGTKYASYQLPGGTNYRELLLTLPPSKGRASSIKEALSLWKEDARAGKRGVYTAAEIDGMDPENISEILNEEYLAPKRGSEYRSSHWEEPNILAHIRVNDRINLNEPRRRIEARDNVLPAQVRSNLPLDIVQGGVLAAAHDDHVRKAIIAALPVEVMDALRAEKASPEDLFGDDAVRLALLSTPDKRLKVLPGFISALRQAEASIGTKVRASLIAGLDEQLLPALRTSDLNPSVVRRFLSSVSVNNGSESSARRTQLGGARPGAALTKAGGAGAEGGIADGALLARHSDIITHRDRTDADGSKTLFIEEIQSDLAQDKRRGKTDFSGPFIDKTEAWLSLAIKRITSYAAENGYDKVAFINGEQSADRYDLSKQIQEINYNRNLDGTYQIKIRTPNPGETIPQEINGIPLRSVPSDRLADVVGKEIAAKMEAGEGEQRKIWDANRRPLKTLSGLDLKVGGSGMKTFYDRIVPQVLSDVLKRVGGKAEAVQINGQRSSKHIIETGPSGSRVKFPDGSVSVWLDSRDQANALIDKSVSLQQPGFTITPEMREKVAGGLPLFARNNAANTESFPRAQAESRIKSILGDKLGKVLIDSGIVTFTNKGNEYQGATYKDGSIVLNLDALSAENFDGVFSHEGFHSTIRDLVGEQTYTQMMKRLENMGATGNARQWFKDAEAAIPSNTKAENRIEELAAYSIEQYVNGTKQPNVIRQWVESLLSALRTAIIRRLPFGKLKSWAVNNLQPQDLANLAIAGLKAKAQGQLQAQGREAMAYSMALPKKSGIDVFDKTERDLQRKHRTGQLKQDEWVSGMTEATDRFINEVSDRLGNREIALRIFRNFGIAPGNENSFVKLREYKLLWKTAIEAGPEVGNWNSMLNGFASSVSVEDAARYITGKPYQRTTIQTAKSFLSAIAETMKYPTNRTVVGNKSRDIKAISYSKINQTDTPDIRYSRAQTANQPAFNIPEPSKMDDVIYAMQDKQVDLRRVVQSIKKAGGKLSDNINAYLQEELFHGRASKGVHDFLNNELRPLVAQMRSLNVDMADFEEYLWNKHAEERNKQIAKINDQMPDGGSGIKTADARAYLSALAPGKKSAYESLAKRVNAINRSSQAILVASGLETQGTIDAWNGAYSNYVPLHREDVDTGNVGTGKGYSIRGSSSKRAVGSNKPVVDILANIAMQRERNIVRAEKNRVSNALYGLAVANPNADLWEVDKAPTERVVVNRGGKDEVVTRIIPGFRQQDNVIHTRINGEDHYVIMDDKNPRSVRMAQAIKNIDMDQLGRVLSNTAKATRYMAAINTQFNPVFGVVNLTRDTQGAMLNLSTTPLAGQQKKVLKYTLSALRGIYADLRDVRNGKTPSSAWEREFEEFQKAGGQTGYRDQYSNATERADAIGKELKSLDRNWAFKRFGAVFDWLSDYNESMENAVRLASFKAAKEHGMSVEQAASLAKNLTVNFNRKGQVATQMGALYAFFNASVQGTARLAETMSGPMGKKILYGGLLLGSMQAMLLAAAGMGEDEPPEFVRERAIIIPIGDGKYVSIPMPLGFHIIPNLSRIPTEFVMSGFKDPAKRIADMVGLFADTFNPIGNSGLSLQTIAPTVIDPLAALSENRDWTGKPIAKLDRDSLNPTPGYLRAKDTATRWSRAISYSLNLLSGGTDYKKGLFSPTPDQIDYLIGQATGGVGREVSKAEQTATSLASGEDLPMHKIPLFGRFIGDTAGQSAEGGKFYASIQRINEHENEIKGLRKEGKADEVRQYVTDNPEAMLVAGANHVEREIQKLRTMKRDAVEKDDVDRVKAIDSQIKSRMKMFNDRVRSLSEKNAA